MHIMDHLGACWHTCSLQLFVSPLGLCLCRPCVICNFGSLGVIFDKSKCRSKGGNITSKMVRRVDSQRLDYWKRLSRHAIFREIICHLIVVDISSLVAALSLMLSSLETMEMEDSHGCCDGQKCWLSEVTIYSPGVTSLIYMAPYCSKIFLENLQLQQRDSSHWVVCTVHELQEGRTGIVQLQTERKS